ncbi:hypothetical protein [Rudanella lutea]|uniref:hypothetical protein n=1 Tax=Rudanella lutea TaxID=451374 RepID=UPI0005C58D4B|nr:hypothetical protein [Rudanella lutea]
MIFLIIDKNFETFRAIKDALHKVDAQIKIYTVGSRTELVTHLENAIKLPPNLLILDTIPNSKLDRLPVANLIRTYDLTHLTPVIAYTYEGNDRFVPSPCQKYGDVFRQMPKVIEEWENTVNYLAGIWRIDSFPLA